jgi:uncharacterized protein (TIGR02271 family)
MARDLDPRGEQYVRLSELDGYRVAPDDPDPRGWTIVDSEYVTVGEVKDLIVDTAVMKVRFFEVDLGGDDRDRHVRIPAEHIDLASKERRAVIRGLLRNDLGRFRGAGTLPAGAGIAAAAPTPGPLPAVPAREREAPEPVGKTMDTEHVSQPVERLVERVRIERRPVPAEDQRSAGAAVRGPGAEEIRVPIIEEELVVEKRPVVKEELVIRKEVVSETETVEADLRREHVKGDAHHG